MKVIIELSEGQAELVKKSLDLYSRILTGQLGEIEYLFRFYDNKYDKDKVSKILDDLKLELFPELNSNSYHSIHSDKINDSARVAYDMLQVIRFHMATYRGGSWTVDHSPPSVSSSTGELCEARVIRK